MNILVTGGAGFIGSYVVEELAKDRSNLIVVVDNLLTGSTSKIPTSAHDNIRFIKGDVNSFEDMSGVFYANQFDYVFHYAAVVGVKRTLENPLLVLEDITGIKNILRLSKNTGVKRVFYASSSEVYGEPVELPQNEHTTPLNSRLPYAIVKNIGEAYCKSFYQQYGLKYTLFRFFNTYGPRQSKDFVVSKFIAAALKGEDITIYGDGQQTRTFCFVKDNVEACLNALKQNKLVNDVVNIGSDVEITVLELAQLIIRLTNSKSKIVHLPPLEEGDMTRRLPDATKMKELLNRKITPLEEGLMEIIKNPSYIL